MPLEDFTTYTEVDIAANRIRVLSATQAQMYDVDLDETCYLYKDFGAGALVSAEVELKLTAQSWASNGRGFFWAFSNVLNDWENDPGPAIGVRLRHSITPASWQISIAERDAGGAVYMDDYYHPNDAANTVFYPRIVWYGNSLIAYIYSDAARTVLLDTLSLTLQSAAYLFRYNYALRSDNVALGGKAIRYLVDDMDLGLMIIERFQEEGTDFRETKFGATWGGR